MIRPLVAAPEDTAAVVETVTLAFLDDPVWAWAFPDADRRAEHYRVWWAMGIVCSIGPRAVWMSDPDAAAVAVWVPPGGRELSPASKLRVEPMVRDQRVRHHAEVTIEL